MELRIPRRLSHRVTLGAALICAALLAPPDAVASDVTWPACAADLDWCFGVHLYVTGPADAPVASDDWLATQLNEANRLFRPSGVGFELAERTHLTGAPTHIPDRRTRDTLGRRRFARGTVQVYVVSRLDDVDIRGEEIRGVHWRDRANRKRRWIILSAISPRLVLAHELGHFFGLRHSKHRGSVMNKSRADPTPYRERVFVPAERERITKRARRYARNGRLRRR